jgi:2-dehydro-3-deoxygluconokinase
MQVVAFGECMIELQEHADGEARIAFGGDTLNTAVYLSRLGVETAYMTALGHDPWSQKMRRAWEDEGLGLSLVLTHPERTVGLYAITTDELGERSFTYWRKLSAARAFFECDEAERALSTASRADCLYLSGITLSLFSPTQRARITQLAKDVRASGGMVAFDPNYRARLWASVADYRDAVVELAPCISVVLPGLAEEQDVWADRDVDAVVKRWAGWGVGEVIVKDGPRGAYVNGAWRRAPAVEVPLDTTGAGDSFNAGYLAGRLAGLWQESAADRGALLAAIVVCHRGAIAPRQATAAMMEYRT